jgi:hypothetical protein
MSSKKLVESVHRNYCKSYNNLIHLYYFTNYYNKTLFNSGFTLLKIAK